jgi:hypothetical protein
MQQVQTNALMSASEVAAGMRYTEALKTSWQPPRYVSTANTSN